jgi:hypothetical protein
VDGQEVVPEPDVGEAMLDTEQDPSLPATIDSVPFDHAGDYEAEPEAEDAPEIPPFDIEAALADA